MNNVIPPLNIPGLGGTPADSGVSGTVENPPPELGKVNIGENIHINISSSRQIAINSLVANMKLGSEEFPIELFLNKSLDLSSLPADVDIVAKLISKNPQNAEIRLVSVNGQRPESLISPQPEISETTSVPRPIFSNSDRPQIRPLFSEHILQTVPETHTPDNTALPTVKLLPLKLAPVLEQLLVSQDIPPQTARAVAQIFPNLELNLQIAPAPEQISPRSEIAKPELLQVVNQIAATVKNEFSDLNLTNLSPEAAQSLSDKLLPKLVLMIGTEISGKLSTLSGKSWPVIETLIGRIIPEVALKIPENSRLLLHIKEISRRPPLLDKFSSPEIKDIFSGLKEKGLDAWQSKLLEKMPMHNEKMLPNIVNFMKAAGQQKLELWLGQGMVEQLRSQGAEGQEVIDKFSSVLKAQTQETPGWRIVNVPFYGDEMFNRIRVAVKKMNDDEENQKNNPKRNKSAVRFVVDTSFSRLGKFQLDGFSFINDRRFDLIVRTEQDFTEDFCSNLMKIFQKSLDEVGYTGNVKVNVKENFIKICEDDTRNTTLEDGIFI